MTHSTLNYWCDALGRLIHYYGLELIWGPGPPMVAAKRNKGASMGGGPGRI